MPYILESIKSNRKIKVFACVKCGCEDIDIGDCGYSSFNVAWGKCKNKRCQHEVEISPCGCDITKKQIAKVWNDENNPKKLKSRYEKEIRALQKKIKALPK